MICRFFCILKNNPKPRHPWDMGKSVRKKRYKKGFHCWAHLLKLGETDKEKKKLELVEQSLPFVLHVKLHF